MRKQFVKTVEGIMAKDDKLVVLLGDIGVFGFRSAFASYPNRIYNIGILEQSTIGLAAGLALTGFVPIVHTIAPFIVERSLEQLKLDFAFQQLGGNFVSVGGSFDYAALGATHHCPADVGILKNIPGMEIVLPGTAEEFDKLFKQSYNNGKPTYFRLSEKSNNESQKVEFGKASIIKRGSKATVIVVGTMLQNVLDAVKNEDVTVLYYTTLEPFDSKTLKNNNRSNKILVCEPYYESALSFDITNSIKSPVRIDYIGMPKKFLDLYGNAEDHEKYLGLTSKTIKTKLKKLIWAN